MNKKLKAALIAIGAVLGVLCVVAAIAIGAMYYPMITMIVALGGIALGAIILLAWVLYDDMIDNL